MKRCPQCEFIYEDDQGCCDMDGVRLVADSQLLWDSGFAKVDVGSLVASSQAAQWRSFALPAVGAAILGVVLFLVYYVSTHPTTPQNTHYSSAQVTVDSQSAATQSAPNPDLTQPAAQPSQTDAEPSTPPVESIQAPPASVKRTSASSTILATTREEKKRKQDRPIRESSTTDPKKDSKVGSFLKKAGNILKKPFRL
jgi:hypothetical protein